MKKIVLTTAATLLIGTVGVNYVVQGKEATENNHYTIDEKVLSEQIDQRHLDELEVLKEVVTLNGLSMNIVEDNKQTRVILLEDKNGIPLYKSVFTKDIERLKVIDFKDGLLYDNLISDKHALDNLEKKDHRQPDIKELSEHKIVSKHIDLKKYEANIVEDNKYKRVIMYANEKGVDQYKSIYLKNKKHVKVIDFKKGLLYDDLLNKKKKTSTKETAPTTKNESTPVVVEKEEPKQEVEEKVEPKQEVTPTQQEKVTPKQEPTPKVESKQEPKKEVTKAEPKQEPKKETAKVEPKKEPAKVNNSSISGYKEYGTIASHVDMGSYSGSIVEDNPGKRIIVFKDSNGHVAYKSIYIKKKSSIKIIKTNGGQIYYGSL